MRNCLRIFLRVVEKAGTQGSSRRSIATEGDPLRLWAMDTCIPEKNIWTPIGDLYSRYDEYCRAGGYKPVARNRFSTVLTDFYHPRVESVKRNGMRGLSGVRLRLEGEVE